MMQFLGLTLAVRAQITNPAPQIANSPADPHADMKPPGLNCATQGAVSSYSTGAAKRVPSRVKTVVRCKSYPSLHSCGSRTAAMYKVVQSYLDLIMVHSLKNISLKSSSDRRQPE